MKPRELHEGESLPDRERVYLMERESLPEGETEFT